MADQIRYRVAQRREGLKVVGVPFAHVAAAQERPPALLQLGKVLGAEDADVERVGVAAVAAVAVCRHERAQHLLGVGVVDRDGPHEAVI